jgi:hypothetical protein
MRGAIAPLPNTSSWRSAQLKKAQGLLYLTILNIAMMKVFQMQVVGLHKVYDL